VKRTLVIALVLAAIAGVTIVLIWPRPRTSLVARYSQPPTHVIRLRDHAERARIAERIASAATQPAASPPSFAPAIHEIEQQLSGCAKHATSVHAKLTVSGDADVGTLIEDAVLTGSDIDPALRDCVRGILIELELPPMALGEHYTADFDLAL
jgi:hypothetical protein